MGRKKIQITRIMDERNRQVSVRFRITDSEKLFQDAIVCLCSFFPSSSVLPVLVLISAAVMVCMDLNRHTSIPKVLASWRGSMTFLCQRGHIYRHDSPATLQFLPEKLMKQQESLSAAWASWLGSELVVARRTASRLWPPRTEGLVPWPGCTAQPLCCSSMCCSCSVVIRSSHCTTTPSHLQGGSAGHTAPFPASAMLVPG